MPAVRPTVRPTSAIAVAARGALVVLVLASCAAPASAPAGAPAVKSSASPTITTSSPSPTPSQASALVSSTLAVLRTVDDTLTGYTIALVADDGRVVARAHASSRSNISDGAHLPRISVSRFRVFFLDGPGDVRAIGREGSNQLMTHLPVGANERAVFAISPDESRIAATIIRYGPPTPECLASCGPTTTFRLYVESLVSGGDHHELQLSAPGPGEVLYPIAWRGDALVLAAGTGWIQNPGLVSPYGAFAYVLVDPANGSVLSRLGSGCYPEGPLARAGTACHVLSDPGERAALAWDGSTRVFPGTAAANPPAALAPSGARLAASARSDAPIVVFGTDGKRTELTASGTPLGWLDETHLVFFRPDYTLAMLSTDAARAMIRPIALGKQEPPLPYGAFFATLPNALDAWPYRNDAFRFEFRYPLGFAIATGGDPSAVSVELTMDTSERAGTNLALARARITASRGSIALERCRGAIPGPGSAQGRERTAQRNGLMFRVQDFGQGAAGTLYRTTVYQTLAGDVCYAIELTVGTAQTGNFAPGTVRQFDADKIDAALRSIVDTFFVLDNAP